MAKIRLAGTVVVGLDAVTQTFGMIGKKGAGKTYLATAIAEQMLDAEAQVVALDPVGNWWGLRLDADGKRPGKDIFVLGGEHGDLPLTPSAGARIAQLLTEKPVSAVLDVSAFRKAERIRFATDFAEEFFHRKKTQRSPVHLFIEESQKFIPQRTGGADKGSERQLGAFEDIVRLGRNYGIGASLITQRPQSVNKEVLSQVECLCVLQVNGKHERDALEAWVQEAGADRKLVGYLPQLGIGEGYIWSPSWLREFKKVTFPKKTTFDASATPVVGKASKALVLSPMDREQLKTDLAAVVEEAERDDPSALKRRIFELEMAARKPQERNYITEREVIPPSFIKALDDLSDRMATIAGYGQAMEKLGRDFHALCVAAAEAPLGVMTYEANGTGRAHLHTQVTPAVMRKAAAEGLAAGWTPSPTNRVLEVRRPKSKSERTLSKAKQRIVDALAWLASVGLSPAERAQVAMFANLSPTAGYTGTQFSELRDAGYIDYPSDGMLQLTKAGEAEVDITNPVPSTSEELQAQVIAKLPAAKQRLLRLLIAEYPDAASRAGIAELANLSPTAGYTGTQFAELRSLGVVEYPSDGMVRASPLLFLDGGRR